MALQVTNEPGGGHHIVDDQFGVVLLRVLPVGTITWGDLKGPFITSWVPPLVEALQLARQVADRPHPWEPWFPEDDIVDAEVVDDPCECVCGDCQAGRHCDRASCAAALDTVYTGPLDDTTNPVGQPATAIDVSRDGSVVALATAQQLSDGRTHFDVHTRVRMMPTGRECWQRLYSTSTSPLREWQDHGVLAAHPVEDDPYALDLEIKGPGYNVMHRVRALAWRVIPATQPSPALTMKGGKEDSAPPVMRGPEAIDLLVEFPPALPHKPCNWQQMTNPGVLQHPGDDRAGWSYNVKYTEAYCYDDRPPSARPSLGEAALSAMGFKRLGRVDEDGVQ